LRLLEPDRPRLRHRLLPEQAFPAGDFPQPAGGDHRPDRFRFRKRSEAVPGSESDPVRRRIDLPAVRPRRRACLHVQLFADLEGGEDGSHRRSRRVRVRNDGDHRTDRYHERPVPSVLLLQSPTDVLIEGPMDVEREVRPRAGMGWGGRLLLSALLLTAGCVSRWTVRSEQPSSVLQWPYAPSPAKVTFQRSLTGFGPEKGSGSFLRSVVYGREKKSSDGFVLPVAVATGSDGRIAVADMGRRCVHLFVPQSHLYLRLDGSKNEKIVSPVAVV